MGPVRNFDPSPEEGAGAVHLQVHVCPQVGGLAGDPWRRYCRLLPHLVKILFTVVNYNIDTRGLYYKSFTIVMTAACTIKIQL